MQLIFWLLLVWAFFDGLFEGTTRPRAKVARGTTDTTGTTSTGKTYTIAADGKSITCLICRWTSYSRDDIKNRYCGHCYLFHEAW